MARTLDPNELVAGLTFIDTAGIRHEGVTLPRHMLNGGSVAAKERWLVSHGEIADPNMPDAPAPVQAVIDTIQAEQQQQQQSAVDMLRQQLDDLQGRLSNQPLSIEELVAARQEIQSFMLKASDANAQLVQVEGRGSQIKADLTAIAAPLHELAAGTAAQQEQVVAVQQTVLEALQQQAGELLDNLSQRAAETHTEAVDSAVAAAKKTATPIAREAALAEVAKHWGSSVTIAAELPTETDPSSWAKRWYGRDFLIPGDGALVETPNSLRTFRFTGRGWVEGGEIIPKSEIRDVKASVLDASTKVTSLQTVSGSGGGGGGGGEHLLVNRIGVGGAIAVADSSNWAGVSDVTSGQIVAELTALDGALRGRTYLVLIPFTWSPAGDQFTVDGELGGLTGLYDINVSVQRSPAVAPAVFTGAMPPGSNRTVVFLSVVPSPGGGGDTTSFRLGGDIEWAHIAQGAAVSLQSGGLQPLWIWS